MNSTYPAGVMSIATAHARAGLLGRMTPSCAQGAVVWQPVASALRAIQAQIAPLGALQGTGMSRAGFSTSTTSVYVKRNRSFEGHTGPRVSTGTG